MQPSTLLMSQRAFSLSRTVRAFSASARRRDLIGPPDPISNLRPVLYDDPPLPSPSPPLTHPYSLNEFRGDARDTHDFDLLWRIRRQQMDAFDHRFWVDNNSRFMAAKKDVLDNLPAGATPLERERALSDFYRHWFVQEATRQRAYAAEWRTRVLSNILLAARAKYRKLAGRR